MDQNLLSDAVLNQLKNTIETHEGLSVFAKERAKFEGWLKVELCRILASSKQNVTPEKLRVDIVAQKWAIELKTVNTNLRYPNVINKHRPITKNVEGVIKDIKKLKNISIENKAVVFVVFPAKHNNSFWQTQLSRISGMFPGLQHADFSFKNGIPGIIYLGIL